MGQAYLFIFSAPRSEEVDLLPQKLVEVSVEVQGSFRCQWTWKLPLLPSIAAATNIFRGSFHERLYTPKYPPPVSNSIANFQLLRKDFHNGPPTSVRPTSMDSSTNFHLNFHESFHGSCWENIASMETSMEVGRSFHASIWSFPLPVEVEASIESIDCICPRVYSLETFMSFHIPLPTSEYHERPAASTRLD